MDKRPKISVIVPVYKAEKFLHSCVDSILAQTYENFELLLIDDGSPDGSGAICEAYAHVDERVRVFHIPNSGANRARAWGVSHASNSEYITFVDSDDTLVPGALETLSLYAADDYDIIVANYERNDKKYTDREMSITEYVNHMFLCNINPSPWARLYRRTLFNVLPF